MVKQHLKIASSFALALALITLVASAKAEESGQTIRADVVALDQPFMLNRLGASLPQGMIFALKRDIVPINPARNPDGEKLSPGNVMLRPDKRPRPIVLRVNMGQYLEIHFTNLLSPVPKNVAEPSTRYAGVHVNGLELVQVPGPNGASQPGINSDATWVGANENGLAAPGETKIYK